jgi:hypothetical protein
MNKKSETLSIEDWLRIVDKPLLKKEEKRGKKTQRKNKIQKKE